MVARILQVAKVEVQLGYCLHDALRILTHAQGTSNGGANLQTLLLAHLCRQLLSAVFCHGVGNFMSEDDGQRSLVLCDGQ